jgi:hypothetical protein
MATASSPKKPAPEKPRTGIPRTSLPPCAKPAGRCAALAQSTATTPARCRRRYASLAARGANHRRRRSAFARMRSGRRATTPTARPRAATASAARRPKSKDTRRPPACSRSASRELRRTRAIHDVNNAGVAVRRHVSRRRQAAQHEQHQKKHQVNESPLERDAMTHEPKHFSATELAGLPGMPSTRAACSSARSARRGPRASARGAAAAPNIRFPACLR